MQSPRAPDDTGGNRDTAMQSPRASDNIRGETAHGAMQSPRAPERATASDANQARLSPTHLNNDKIDEFTHILNKILHERAEYGKPTQHFSDIANRWYKTLGTDIRPENVAQCMLDLKMERLRQNPENIDTIIDIAGYAFCIWNIINEK